MTLKVYRSSAGSGKTFTLALEYLSLALTSPYAFRHILGVTFTNKAANEMKQRIIRFLQILADDQHPETSLRALLLKRMLDDDQGTSSEVQMKASRVFFQLLHNYSDFSVSTIDAFVYRLVRTFSRDVALPAQFELLLDSEEIVERLVDRLYEYVGIDNQLTEHLLTFLLENMDDNNNHYIEQMIKEFCLELLSERSVRHASAISKIDYQTFKEIKIKLRTEYSGLIQELLIHAGKAIDLLHRYNVEPEELAYGSNGAGVQLVKLLESSDFENFFDKKNVLKAFGEQKTIFRKESISKIPLDLVIGLESIFSEIGQWYEANFGRALLLSMIIPDLSTLALTSRIYRETEQMIQDEQIVHISEFNKRVAGLLGESGVPFIYERLGERYQHFLLDEFQDTSILQWSNFLPLIENGLSAGHNSLIVGDAKQAIYRWRNGEVELFIRLPEVYPSVDLPHLKQYTSTLGHHFQLFNLKSNFRSAPGIVSFNNQFFRFVSGSLPERYKQLYDDCQQISSIPGDNGFVSVSFLTDQEGLKAEEIALIRLVETLNKLFEEGYSAGDIAILCRTNKQCRSVARRLTDEGIKIVSSESLQLNSSASVNAVVSALRMIAEGENKLFSVELRSALAVHRNDPDGLLEALQPEGDLSMGADYISSLHDKAGHLSLYDLTESIIRLMGLHKPYDVFLQAFLDKVLAFQTSEGEGVSAFLRQWDDKLMKAVIALPPDKTAVAILTVHKAKGLEFPVVLIPFAEFSSSSNRNKRIWVDLAPDLVPPFRSALLKPIKRMLQTPVADSYLMEQEKVVLDTINLTYVAFTRPEERLYMFLPRMSKSSSKEVGSLMKEFLRELGALEEDKNEYTFGLPYPPKSRKTTYISTHLFAEAMPTGRILGRQESTQTFTSDAIAFGNKMHRILSSIYYANEIDNVIGREIELGLLASSESQYVKRLILAIVNHQGLKSYYLPPARICNEASFADGEGRVNRVDRYVELDGQHTIIEYKTGSPDKLHLEQLLRYKHFAERIEGTGINGLLVYLSDEPQVIVV